MSLSCAKKENLSFFRCLLVFVVLVQLVGAIAIVFYISYSSATAAGERIFQQLVRGVIERSRVEVDEFFKHPLRLVRIVHAASRMMLPDMPNWSTNSGFYPSTTPVFMSALNFWLSQAQSSVVVVGLGSVYGSAYAVRDPGSPQRLVFSDGTGIGNVSFAVLNEEGKQSWDYVREDLPLNETLTSMLQQNRARIVDHVVFDQRTRDYYKAVSHSAVVAQRIWLDQCLYT